MSRPDPTVELKALTAMALDLTRVDPDRSPGERLMRWHRELAEIIGDEATPVQTNRELLRDAIRLTRTRQELLVAS
jgi:hypothetical protein